MSGTVEGYVAYVLSHQIARDGQLVLPPVCSNGGWAPLEEEDRERAVALLREGGLAVEWVAYSALRVTRLLRYRVTTKWWELAPPPRWIAAFWFTEMIWILAIHHSCSLTTYHDAETPWQAQTMAYEFVDKYPWSDRPKYRILVGRARLIS